MNRFVLSENYCNEQIDIAREFIHEKDYEMAIDQLKETIAVINFEKKYLTDYFTAIKLLALCYRKINNYRMAELELNKGITLLKKVFMDKFTDQAYKEYGNCIVNLGIVYESSGDLEKAVMEYNRAEKIFKIIADNQNLFKLYLTIFFASLKMNNLEKARDYLNNAIYIAKQNHIEYDEEMIKHCYLMVKEAEKNV